jgi:dTDP-4-dehydrorhamnose reductase
MTDALIGHTGFVGSTLARDWNFQACFNSKTIQDIDGARFDTIVCAGVTAVKWLANKEPEVDLAAIQGLIRHLDTVAVSHFILISTIDVYRDPIGVSEADIPPTEGLHPYGLNRLHLENFVANRFPQYTIVRLPGLFGSGLRKNLIFDMLTGNQTDKINPVGKFQWYPMRRFAGDLARIAEAAPKIVNVAIEPVETETIRSRWFSDVIIDEPRFPAPKYDMHTNQPELLGHTGNYHLSAEIVLDELDQFVTAERAGVLCA